MIACLQGEIFEIRDEQIILMVGGVGYLVFVTAAYSRQAQRGEGAFVYTYMVVREDAMQLYGFSSQEERDTFSLLLGANKVGPKTALAILGGLSVDAIRRAVLAEQPEVFARISGVGKKTAQAIMIHLQGKVGTGEGLAGLATIADIDTELIDALTSLGYSVVEAQAAIQSIPKDTPAELETRLRLALRYFS